MKKIGNGMRSYGLLLLFLSIAVSLSAQDENVQVETTLSESQVYEGERVSLGIVIKSNDSQNITRPDMPQVDGFRYASSYPSTSTSYSMMNGVSAMNYSFTWQLIATHEGVHQVPPVSVVINGETYETEPVTITVLNAQQRPDQQAMDQQPDVFLEMEVSDQSPVRGQQLIADLVIYFKREMDLSSYQVSQGWVTEGFWQEDLNENHSARAENVMVNGTRYRRAVLRKHALFPTRQGELKLQPYKIQANIRQNTRGGNTRDFFGGFRSSTRTMNLESDELTINVQDLPDAPNGLFINAVGDLNVSRSLSEQQIKLGESVEIVTEIAGNGNISLVTRPAYNFSSDFDVYRPQETTDLDTRSGRVSGKKVFRDVIIARRVGSYDIPETEVAIYDDVQRRYETVTLPGMSIDVIRDPNAQIGFVHDGRFNITP
ncbi:MAG: BatD family protein, partial [Balneolales bacterium]